MFLDLLGGRLEKITNILPNGGLIMVNYHDGTIHTKSPTKQIQDIHFPLHLQVEP